MKKRYVLSALLLFALLTTGAHAQAVPADVANQPEPMTLAWFIKMSDYMQSQIGKYDHDHSFYSFYSSMGCSNISCTDLAHTHWCPHSICLNLDHGHSDAEYKTVAAYHPVCSCREH